MAASPDFLVTVDNKFSHAASLCERSRRNRVKCASASSRSCRVVCSQQGREHPLVDLGGEGRPPDPVPGKV
jgi:hypothetical protein